MTGEDGLYIAFDAVAFISAEAAPPPGSIVLDDADAVFEGNADYWYTAPPPDAIYYAGQTHWTYNQTSVQENWATWTPTAPLAGNQQLWAFVPSYHSDTSSANYQVYHNNQVDTVELDQSRYLGDWVSLGVFDFTAVTPGYVTLGDVTGEPTHTRHIAFDALAFTPNELYLPVVLRNYPKPPKQHTGIHLGNRNADWLPEMIEPIDGDNGGEWPKAVVVLSEQIWHIERNTTPPCEIVNVYPRPDRSVAYNYLRRAAQNQVQVIVRIYPSPGNFEDWNQPVKDNHRLVTDVTPAGDDYCNLNYHQFRSIADVADEMGYIHAANVADGWVESGFESANEPNIEWYGSHTDPEIANPLAWDDMDAYFSALYVYVHEHYLDIKVFTPPMSQGAFAEGVEWSDLCGARLLTDGTCGYDHMRSTYETHNDGYSWHNYWNQGREGFVTCKEGGGHVFTAFPDWLQQAILNSTNPVHITESDLHSLCQGTGNPLNWKDDDPVATTNSLLIFINQGDWLVDFNAVWLLNDNTGYRKDPNDCNGETDERYLREHDWHEAYDEDDRDPPEGQEFRLWFTTWWPQAP